ncbi:MAG: SDR family oxidoreductase [Bacteroidetes bacterium]|nr:MAG: SDR family oxidoreductase [Bacteroidota bacterium]
MNRNILIVGGTSGIGAALVEHLRKEGDNLLLLSRRPPSVNDSSIKHHTFDATIDPLPTEILPEQLDGLVYCPGSINLKPFRSLKAQHFEEDFRINVLGAVNVLQATEKALKAAGGSVVLFSTVAVSQGMAFHASTATSKAAVEGLARSLAAEWAPRVRVNVIAPSLTNTPLAERLLNNEQKKQAAAERHPLKKIGSPGEIAAMAAFMLSDEAQWITGQVFGVDGGMSTLR